MELDVDSIEPIFNILIFSLTKGKLGKNRKHSCKLLRSVIKKTSKSKLPHHSFKKLILVVGLPVFPKLVDLLTMSSIAN